MARTESRIKCAIWLDEDFRALTAAAQRAYFLVISQPTISLCGVTAYTPGRWAGFSSDETAERVDAALSELERARFVVVDRHTQEVWVRTFLRHDGVARSPKTLSAARAQAAGIVSPTIRAGVEEAFRQADTPSDTQPDTEPDTPADQVSDTPRARVRAVSDTSLRHQSPVSDTRGYPPAQLTPSVPRPVGQSSSVPSSVASFDDVSSAIAEMVADENRGTIRTTRAKFVNGVKRKLADESRDDLERLREQHEDESAEQLARRWVDGQRRATSPPPDRNRQVIDAGIARFKASGAIP